MKHDDLSGRVIGCFLTAYNELGFGFPEVVYAAALEILFRQLGLDARREHGIDVIFRDVRIARYRVDFIIEDTLILELKAGYQLPAGSKSQLLTYLRATKKDLGLVLFFGPSPEVQRVVI